MPNRRTRRAEHQPTESPSTIPGSMRPSEDPRNQSPAVKGNSRAKTLLEIAAERQAVQSHLPAGATLKESNVVNVTIDADGTVRSLDGSPLPDGVADAVQHQGAGHGEGQEGVVEDEIPPLLDTLLLSLPLSAVHFTLAVLAMHQFAQEVQFGRLAWETGVRAFPALTLLVHLFRGHLVGVGKFGWLGREGRRRVVLVRGLVYLVVANVAGCYLLTLTNGRGYYAAVKHAPGVGTLWVWAVLEMGLVGAVGGVTGPAVFAWWHGYGF